MDGTDGFHPARDHAVPGLSALATSVTADRSAEESAAGALRTAILRGILEPGVRLRQEDIAEQLGVSRIPLRDAFRRLEAEGLVRIEGRRGARVAALSAADVNEIYEMRLLLEVHCVRLAVRNVTDEGVARLMEMSTRMHVDHEGEPGRIARREFYAELYGWADRPKMRDMIIRLRDDVHRYHVLSSEYDSHSAHRELLDLIAARDADGAARAIRRHLREAREDLVGSLRREERLREAAARKARRRR
ncbi:MAG TPA: GntR family transcriptional regulator [Candidatus Limnocylindrales bacterium]|nr:GntR family transcriptional regulator [Candidatus Limnocylindrales bacterium]